MTNTFSVLFYLLRTKAQEKLSPDQLEQEKIPIYCRITVNSVRINTATKMAIEKSRWEYTVNKDGKDAIKNDQRVLGTKPDAKIINSKLNNMELKLIDIFNKLEANEEYVTASLVKDVYDGKISKNRPTLLSVFDRFLSDCDDLVLRSEMNWRTHARNKSVRNNMETFIKDKYNKDDVLMQDMSQPGKSEFSFAKDFEHWGKTRKLEDSKGKTTKPLWAHNHCAKQISMTHHAFNHGIKCGIITVNPFHKKVPVAKKGMSKYLKPDEIGVIEEKDMNSDCLNTYKDIFLFSCYTGLAFSEVKAASWYHVSVVIGSNIEENKEFSKYWLFIGRKKTSNSSMLECKIPLLKKAYDIILKYKNDPRCINQNVLLPVPSNVKYNVYLKDIQGLCKIVQNLTSHVARHTCARIFLDNGFSKEYVADMLGHATTKLIGTTYGKFTETRMSREIKEVGKQSHALYR